MSAFLNFFKTLPANVTKGAAWFIHVLTNTQAVVSTLTSLAPQTIAAVTSVFYDVVKFVVALAGKEALDIAGKNITGAINDVLSADTLAMIAKIVADFKAADAQIVADFHALGIAAQSDKPAA